MGFVDKRPSRMRRQCFGKLVEMSNSFWSGLENSEYEFMRACPGP